MMAAGRCGHENHTAIQHHAAARYGRGLERKIQSGRYASVSEVLRDGVRALLERDAAMERWLREDVVAGHQEYLADPSKGVPADEVLPRIKARRGAREAG